MNSPHTGKPMERMTKRVSVEFKGDHILIDWMYYYCPDAGLEYTNEETDDMNLNQVYLAYSKKHNIPIEQVKP